MSTGHSILRIRVPALTDGHLVPLDFCQLKGKWITICCPSRFGLVETLFLDRYRQEWEKQVGLLLGLVSGNYPFHEPWVQRLTRFGIFLLGDPLGCVGRALKISEIPDQSRCQCLLINPEGIVDYHLVHNLNGRGMSAIFEIFQLCKNFKIRLEANPDQAHRESTFSDSPLFTGHAITSRSVPQQTGSA